MTELYESDIGYSITADQIPDAVNLARRMSVALMLTGAPGTSKSEQVLQTLSDQGIGSHVLILGNHEAVDLTGMPHLVRDPRGHMVTDWAQPGFWPTHPDAPVTIVLDEYSQARTELKNVVGQLVHERRYPSGIAVPNCVQFVLIGNRAQDRAGTTRSPTQINSRLIHYMVDPAPAPFLRWAMSSGRIAPMVIAYLHHHQDACHEFNPSEDVDRPYPCWRTWEHVSKAIAAGIPQGMELATYSGCVGAQRGAEFHAYSLMADRLPNADLVYLDPDSAPIPADDSGALFAYMTAVSALATPLNLDKLVRYTQRLNDAGHPEHNVLAMQYACRRDKSLASTAAFRAWSLDPGNEDVLFG